MLSHKTSYYAIMFDFRFKKISDIKGLSDHFCPYLSMELAKFSEYHLKTETKSIITYNQKNERLKRDKIQEHGENQKK